MGMRTTEEMKDTVTVYPQGDGSYSQEIDCCHKYKYKTPARWKWITNPNGIIIESTGAALALKRAA